MGINLATKQLPKYRKCKWYSLYSLGPANSTRHLLELFPRYWANQAFLYLHSIPASRVCHPCFYPAAQIVWQTSLHLLYWALGGALTTYPSTSVFFRDGRHSPKASATTHPPNNVHALFIFWFNFFFCNSARLFRAHSARAIECNIYTEKTCWQYIQCKLWNRWVYLLIVKF